MRTCSIFRHSVSDEPILSKFPAEVTNRRNRRRAIQPEVAEMLDLQVL
jgi:hypothetical protein